MVGPDVVVRPPPDDVRPPRRIALVKVDGPPLDGQESESAVEGACAPPPVNGKKSFYM